jgi:hypothetical protein
MYSSEAINEKLADAQHRLLQAMGELDDALVMVGVNEDEKLKNLIETQKNAINMTDNRLGDIRTGRNI